MSVPRWTAIANICEGFISATGATRNSCRGRSLTLLKSNTSLFIAELLGFRLIAPELILGLFVLVRRLVIAVHRVFVEAGLTVGIAAHGTASGVLRRHAGLGAGNTPRFLRLRCLCVPYQISRAPPISSTQKAQAVKLISASAMRPSVRLDTRLPHRPGTLRRPVLAAHRSNADPRTERHRNRL